MYYWVRPVMFGFKSSRYYVVFINFRLAHLYLSFLLILFSHCSKKLNCLSIQSIVHVLVNIAHITIPLFFGVYICQFWYSCFSLISRLHSLSLFPCSSYATFMLTSSRTSVPKTQRSTLGNSTTLSLKKERYVNKKSSRHSAVKFVYLFTSFPLCSVTIFSLPSFYCLCFC